MRNIVFISLCLSALFFAFSAFPQTILERNICTTVTSSQFIYDHIKAPESDRVCRSGTQMRIANVSGDANMASTLIVTREGGGQDGPHRGIVDIEWASGTSGIISFDVEYRRKESDWKGECDWEGWKYMYTYKIYRLDVNPSGTLTGAIAATATNEQSESTFNFSYVPSASYPSLLTATKISYPNGRTDNNGNPIIIESDIIKSSGVYTPANLAFYARGFGQFTLNVSVKDDCDRWYNLSPKTLNVYPSCYQDSQNNPSITISGPELETFPEGYQITNGSDYTLHVLGIHDFNSHYTWNDKDGGADINFNQTNNTFIINKEIGSYRIETVRKNGRELCPVMEVSIFINGRDQTIPPSECPMVLPDALIILGYKIDDVVLKHFSVTVISKRSITVKPGVTMTLGAELVLNVAPPAPNNGDADSTLNFTEQTAYDEYGRIVLSSRSYYDDQGKFLQSQFKSLTNGVVLANATVYDAYGRGVISTLSAPVRADTSKVQKNGCNEDISVQANLKFAYKEDFITDANGNSYNHMHFDLIDGTTSKEENPDPVGNHEGTLGWYYSANNGTAIGKNERLNEQFVAHTAFPYSRTLFYRDGSGEVKGSTRPGNVFKAGSGVLATTANEKVPNNDANLNDYFVMRSKLGLENPAPSEYDGNFFRTTVTDENGKSATSYTDKGGKAIISINNNSHIKSYQFYDDAGRLVVSVSPNGVDTFTGSNFKAIDKTTYTYNYKGWITEMAETDADTTRYIYRKDGKIRFSQNAEQKKNGSYSYTNYDRSGRPLESGEYNGTLTFANGLNAILENVGYEGGITGGSRSFWIRTYYDQPANIIAQEHNDASLNIPVSRVQRFINGAVSCTRNDNVTTWYSYDEQSRVEWLVQDINDLGVKTIDYRYGPTGAVQEVTYQKDSESERFAHFYEYDMDGRLSKVYTTQSLLAYSRSGQLENPAALTLQATYIYYLHGPLKRIEYANKLQGIDYVYKVDGSLKSINDALPANDPGQDGNDVFGMTLDYYSGDYLNAKYNPGTVSYPETVTNQYAGHIKGTRWHSPIENHQTFAYAYEYDDRYQFKKATWGSNKTGSLQFIDNSYQELIGTDALEGYDKNGNIQLLKRTSNIGQDIADFKYNYVNGTNRLETITNSKNSSDYVRKYQYNLLGQMTEQENVEEGTKQKIEYDVSGKVIAVRDKNNNFITSFNYDDRGFRVKKINYDSGAERSATWYVRDAGGNIVTTYEDENLADTVKAKPVEVPVYANGRIGLFKPQYGLTFYELIDHLGNVRAVIGDTVSTEYLATMEAERRPAEQCVGCPFFNLKTDEAPTYVNHTLDSVTVDGETFLIENPDQVIRLNNAVGTEKNPIGGGIILPVYPGDKISAEVYAKYQNFDSENKASVTGMAAYLATLFGPTRSIIDGVNIFNGLDQAPAGVFEALSDIKETLPKAFLTYIVYDRNYVPIDFDYKQVSTDAKIPDATKGEGDPFDHPHERLALEDIVIEKEGFIYIYVSNQSDQNMEVFFDDLRVKHLYSNIVAGNDYYPFGSEIDDRRITRENYRFGYQGQFAEKDEETGWNHFELRDYDPVIGRWTAVDPAGQYWSPYVGMGNDPVNGVDPDGAYSRFGAWWRSGFSNDIYQDGGEWGFNTIEDGGFVPHFGDEMKRTPIDFSQNEVLNGLHQKQWMTDFNYRAKYGGDGIKPDYTIESFIVGGALFKGGVQGASWAGQRLLYGTSNRVFWSGGLGSAGETAASYAAANGAITLEMTFTGKALTGLTNMTSYSTTKPLWNLASRGFANGARGSAEVFINPVNITSKSIWLTTERSILRANGIPYNYNIIPH